MMRSLFEVGLSGEPLPARWRWLLLAAVAAMLLAAPWTSAAGGMDFAARVLLLATLAAANDLVLGRGGAMMLTLGLYSVVGGTGIGIAIGRLGAGPLAVALGALAAVIAVLAADAVVSWITWKARRWVFTLVSLTVAVLVPLGGSMAQLAHQGAAIPFVLPSVDPRFAYGLLLVVNTTLALVVMRFANSPFGRVLPALRDNLRLAETLGYRPTLHRAISTAMAAGVAVVAGIAFALWQQASAPLVSGSLDLTLQVLVVGLVGGLGSLWAAPVGAVVVLLAWQWLPWLLQLGASRVPDVPWLAALLSDPSSQAWVMAAIIGALGWAVGGLMARRS